MVETALLHLVNSYIVLHGMSEPIWYRMYTKCQLGTFKKLGIDMETTPPSLQDQEKTPANCPSRFLLNLIADKWSVLILAVLCDKPQRFNAIKRRLEGITQKALTQSLRRLERNGIVDRRVITSSPIAVEYWVTPLGRTLKEPFQALHAWTFAYLSEVEKARLEFDRRTKSIED